LPNCRNSWPTAERSAERRTYYRLREQAVKADALVEEDLHSGAERLVADFDKKLERLKKRKYVW
jgi:hypothetical protein